MQIGYRHTVPPLKLRLLSTTRPNIRISQRSISRLLFTFTTIVWIAMNNVPYTRTQSHKHRFFSTVATKQWAELNANSRLNRLWDCAEVLQFSLYCFAENIWINDIFVSLALVNRSIFECLRNGIRATHERTHTRPNGNSVELLLFRSLFSLCVYARINASHSICRFFRQAASDVERQQRMFLVSHHHSRAHTLARYNATFPQGISEQLKNIKIILPHTPVSYGCKHISKFFAYTQPNQSHATLMSCNARIYLTLKRIFTLCCWTEACTLISSQSSFFPLPQHLWRNI